jgi:hypothetical protein
MIAAWIRGEFPNSGNKAVGSHEDEVPVKSKVYWHQTLAELEQSYSNLPPVPPPGWAGPEGARGPSRDRRVVSISHFPPPDGDEFSEIKSVGSLLAALFLNV